jgi:hypothetical protein
MPAFRIVNRERRALIVLDLDGAVGLALHPACRRTRFHFRRHGLH